MNPNGNGTKPKPKNVLGGELKTCSTSPMTGFFRDGCCQTGVQDTGGGHLVCAEVTEEFLEFSRSRGNDLITPMPQFNFPGLQPGDKWCLSTLRWVEAFEAGAAPLVDLEATNAAALKFVSLEDLKKHAL